MGLSIPRFKPMESLWGIVKAKVAEIRLENISKLNAAIYVPERLLMKNEKT
jgi:hypothetical protein